MAEKLRVLQAADACKAPGELGALLRRESIYSSHLAAWRKLRATLGTAGLAAKRRGPAPKRSPYEKRIAELEREIARLGLLQLAIGSIPRATALKRGTHFLRSARAVAGNGGAARGAGPLAISTWVRNTPPVRSCPRDIAVTERQRGPRMTIATRSLLA